MASVIQVANRALTKLGAARIISLDDNNKQARSISNCFEDLRDAELRAHRWQFSIKRSSLAASAEAPAYGFQNQFPLPSDFLRLDMIADQYPDAIMDDYIGTETAEWAIEGNMILTSMSAPLKIRYVAQVTDPNDWDALFREALACRIAAEICEDLTQSNEKRQLAWKERQQAISDAIRIGAIERPPQMPPDDNLILSRL